MQRFDHEKLDVYQAAVVRGGSQERGQLPFIFCSLFSVHQFEAADNLA